MFADVCEGAGEVRGVRVGGEGLDDGARRGGAEGFGEGAEVVRIAGEEGYCVVAMGRVSEDPGDAGALVVSVVRLGQWEALRCYRRRAGADEDGEAFGRHYCGVRVGCIVCYCWNINEKRIGSVVARAVEDCEKDAP